VTRSAHVAVLFDLDGTLVDTAPDMAGTVNDMLERRSRPALSLHEMRPLVSNGSRALVEHAFGREDEAATQRRIGEFLEVYATRVARHSALFAGMDALLASLERQSIVWGVVTNKPEGLSRALMAGLALDQRAGVLIGGDTLAQRKPHPLPLLHAAQKIDAPAARCVYVGDAERDISAGRSAGMTTITAGYGYVPTDDSATSWGANFLVHTVEQLDELLMRRLLAKDRIAHGYH